MEVITIESSAFKYLKEKLSKIEQIAIDLINKVESAPEDGWVDSYEACTVLNISGKTLQRLRNSNAVAYSPIGGKYFYRVSEIRRLLSEKLVRCSGENLQDLIKNQRFYVEQKHAFRTNK